MPTCDNINTKAFQELILYYLQERITNKNIEIKYLVITDIFEWFIFNASDFEKLFASDKSLIQTIHGFWRMQAFRTNTDFFIKILQNNLSMNPIRCSCNIFWYKRFETIIKMLTWKMITSLLLCIKYSLLNIF